MANITIVVTGGVRAPSALELLDKFLLDGHAVRVLASGNGLKFLTVHLLRNPTSIVRFLRRFRPQLLESLAYFCYARIGVPHIAEGKWADVVLVMPATCNSVGKIVAGITDNFPLQVIRAVPRTKKVIVVPSMNPEMWFDPHFQRNVDLLNRTEKYEVISPKSGVMTSGDTGFGAQAGIEDILEATYRALGFSKTLESVFAVSGLAGRPSPPIDVAASARKPVLVVESDQEVRKQLCESLLATALAASVYPFERPSEALAWIEDNQPSLLLTELVFPGGETSHELISACRRRFGGNQVDIIVTSTKERHECDAERLARQDIQFLRKPLNLGFTVGMIAGSLASTVSAPHARLRKAKKGEILLREGDAGAEVYLIESGRLRIYKTHNGLESTIAIVGAGEIVGEMSFLDSSTRSASAIAIEDCEVLVLNLNQFHAYLERQPAWLRQIIATLLSRLREQNEQAARVGLTVPGTVAKHQQIDAA